MELQSDQPAHLTPIYIQLLVNNINAYVIFLSILKPQRPIQDFTFDIFKNFCLKHSNNMYRLENCEYEHEGRLLVLITVTEMNTCRSMFVFWSIFLERGNVIILDLSKVLFVEGRERYRMPEQRIPDSSFIRTHI